MLSLIKSLQHQLQFLLLQLPLACANKETFELGVFKQSDSAVSEMSEWQDLIFLSPLYYPASASLAARLSLEELCFEELYGRARVKALRG